MDVVKEALEFDDGDGGVRVVELNDDLFGEILPSFVVLAETAEDVVQRAGNEEVLLHEAQFLAALGLVIGIEDLGDGLDGVFFRARPRRSRRD